MVVKGTLRRPPLDRSVAGVGLNLLTLKRE